MNKIKYKGTTMVKVVGILMIIFGSFSVLGSIASLSAMFTNHLLISFIFSLAFLAIGILGVSLCRKPQVAIYLLGFVVIYWASSILYNIMSLDSVLMDTLDLKYSITSQIRVVGIVFIILFGSIFPLLMTVGLASLSRGRMIYQQNMMMDPNMQPQGYMPNQPQGYMPNQPQSYMPNQPQGYMQNQPQGYMPNQQQGHSSYPQGYEPNQPQNNSTKNLE